MRHTGIVKKVVEGQACGGLAEVIGFWLLDFGAFQDDACFRLEEVSCRVLYRRSLWQHLN